MANEHLDNLVTSGLLKAEPPSADEVSGLVRSGTARLRDARNADLSLESRFDLAYNAAHALSLAGLRIAGGISPSTKALSMSTRIWWKR